MEEVCIAFVNLIIWVSLFTFISKCNPTGDDNKLQSYLFRDNDLHRLLFLPKGLPDGTELAYYVKSQVCYRGLN